MTPSHHPAPDLRVVVDLGGDSTIDAFLLAPAIRTIMGGGEWPAGPERQVADAVVQAVETHARAQRSTWR